MHDRLLLVALATLFCFSLSAHSQETILVIGDSQTTGRFGRAFHDELLKQFPDSDVHTYGKCGAEARSWRTHRRSKCGYFERHNERPGTRRLQGSMPNFRELVRRHQPTLVAIQLGGNMAGRSERRMKANTQLLLADLDPETECAWIGTSQGYRPSRRERRITSDWIKETTTDRCRFFDSWNQTLYPNRVGDGRHFSRWRYRIKNEDSLPFPRLPGQFVTGFEIAEHWARATAQWLREGPPCRASDPGAILGSSAEMGGSECFRGDSVSFLGKGVPL